MYKYFFVLNWLILGMVVLIYNQIVPLLHGYSVLAGSILAAMLSGGLVSWQFFRDSDSEKEWKWRKRYFQKDYGIEVSVQAIIAVIGLGLGCLIWSKLHVITGFAVTYCFNVLIEWGWAKVHHWGKYARH